MTTPQITSRNGKSILIPTEEMLSAELFALPAGIQSDLGDIRRKLASEYEVDQTCPVTTQRLLVQFSKGDDVPFWRVVDPGKPFANRLVGGADRVREKLSNEKPGEA